MRCNTISPETLTALHESALPWWQALALKRHARRCADCQAQLAHFTKLDVQLQTLAPIPAELRQPFVQQHRRLLISSSIALAVVGVGTWRFFTPEITWDDVETAMSHVQEAQWHRSICFYPAPESAPDAVTGVVSLFDPELRPSKILIQQGNESHRRRPILHETNFSGSVPLSLERLDQILTKRNYDGFAPIYKHEYGTSGLSSRVQVWQRRRVIAFTFHYAGFNTGGFWRLPQCEDTILVDPRTCRVLERQRLYREVNGRVGCRERSENIRYGSDLP